MRRVPLYGAVAALAAGLAWHTYTAGRADNDEAWRADLALLRTINADLDNRAMSASFGLLPSYDDLVASVEALQLHTVYLVDVSKNTERHRALLVIADRVGQRQKDIDDLKELRNRLNNAERILRETLEDRAKRGESSPAVDALRRHLLSHRLVPSADADLEAIDAVRAALDADEDTRELRVHFDEVRNRSRELNALTKKLLERGPESLTTLVHTRSAEQAAEMEAHRQQANNGRLAALALGLVLVLAGLWLEPRGSSPG